ncbi:MAG: asparagine synthase (glutamine-hydrolyzing) [Acetobacter sp.]|nr:asparagine synthase (glutamine-hydrolyzing) [Bacteroides sp.]MCM1340994.1 asparagine synthase (glutamine-hydrolyzing) [Acetobacter sp.]MCM1432450.1 asparagine synthase (glutamine-hydrolyzing) [Clostridiales bacterium]
MCGIAGILCQSIDLRAKKPLIERISNTLKQRGPDGKGEYITANTALIHRRLSVVDVAKGAQPMRFGKYIIVYNGELYNTAEVRDELTGFGYNFNTHCDTEVVLKAYDKWQDESVKRLNGIFAYAVYNEEDNSLFYARDRIGVKPAYYSKVGDLFAFSSRIAGLLCIPEIKPVVDENGLNEIFMLGPAKTIGSGIFRDISELPPAHYMTYKKGKINIKSYWKLEAKEQNETINEAIEHTYYLVKDSIERQLVSDVPLATFLSGGLDSSIISKVAGDYFKSDGKTLNTYSVDYVDNDKYFKKSLFQPNKDSDYIGMISDFIGTKHHNIILDNSDVAKALAPAAIARGVPAFADVDSSLLLFCKEVKKNYTVCLSGECADEIFGGYPWYHRKEILFEDCFPWSRSTDVRRSILKNGFLPNGDEYARNAYLSTVKNTDFLDSDTPLEKRMREMFMLNMNYFMQTLLARKDVMSMEASLEVRVPFCDYRLVEYAYNMPWSIKALDGREKGILRKAFDTSLPYEIAWRKKSPYPKTHNPIYFKYVCDLAKEALDDKNTPIGDMLNKKAIFNLMEHPDSMTEPWYGQLMQAPQVLAYIYQIYIWAKNYNVEFDI